MPEKSIIDEKKIPMLVAIISFGFILRLVGYDWGGQKTIFQPDEYTVVSQIMDMANNHTYLHDNWTYPSMCSSQLIAGIMMLISKMLTVDWINYYYIARIFYVIFSTVNIILSYLLVKKCVGSQVAILFSFLVSINPIYIKYAKQVVGDTPTMMFWLLVAIFMCEYISSNKVKYLLFMSFFAACASLEKWNGFGVTIFIAIGVISHNYKYIKQLFIHGITSFFSWALSVILIAPNILLDWKKMIMTIFEANQSVGNEALWGHIDIFFSYSGIGACLLLTFGI